MSEFSMGNLIQGVCLVWIEAKRYQSIYENRTEKKKQNARQKTRHEKFISRCSSIIIVKFIDCYCIAILSIRRNYKKTNRHAYAYTHHCDCIFGSMLFDTFRLPLTRWILWAHIQGLQCVKMSSSKSMRWYR